MTLLAGGDNQQGTIIMVRNPFLPDHMEEKQKKNSYN
jgi:hypothetical protein